MHFWGSLVQVHLEMKRPQNSDSETSVENKNWTSRTDFCWKPLWDFFGAPCIIERQTKEFILKELSNNKTATAPQSHNFQER